MATRIVSSQTEFISAMRASQGGDTVLLKDGDYGSVILDPLYLKTMRSYDSEVTIAALNPGKATFDTIDLRRADHVTLDGITVTDTFKVWMDSEDITVNGMKAKTIIARDSSDFTLTNSETTGGQFGLLISDVSGFTVKNNYLHHAIEDIVRVVGGSNKGLFQNNVIYDTVGTPGLHNDLMQFFKQRGETPHGITIRENLLIDDISTGVNEAQGIFLNNPGNGYSDILIEQNLVSSAMSNTIYVNGGVSNVMVRDNTLTGDQWSVGGLIRIPSGFGMTGKGVTVENNITRGVMDETDEATVGDNAQYGTGAYFVVRNDPDQFFQFPDAKDWTSFLPKNSAAFSLDSGYGAAAFLKKLQAGSVKIGVTADATGSYSPDGALSSAWTYTGKNVFTGAHSTIVSEKDSAAFDLDRGTIAVSFEASTLSWRRGLISKDSEGVHNGFSAWIEEGVLKVSFEGDTRTAIVTSNKVKVNTDHTLVTAFGDGHARVWLDGALIGSVGTGMDWTKNHDQLVIGGQNAASDEGSTDARRYAFTGEINEVAIYDQAMSLSAYESMLA